MIKPVSTATRFTQAEVRLIVCLLARNPSRPGKDVFGTKECWKRTVANLRQKFARIDRRTRV